MSPIGVMVTQVNYVNRQRVKDDAKRVTDVYKSLTAKIAVYGELLTTIFVGDYLNSYFGAV